MQPFLPPRKMREYLDGKPKPRHETTYQFRERMGLCHKCGDCPPREGKALCQSCSDKAKQQYAQDKADGICVKSGCSDVAQDDHVHCRKHAQMARRILQGKEA